MTGTAASQAEHDAWQGIVDGVQALYPEPLPPAEAQAAAKRLVDLYRVMLAVKRRQLREAPHEPASCPKPPRQQRRRV